MPKRTGLKYQVRISHIIAGLLVWAVLIALGWGVVEVVSGVFG